MNNWILSDAYSNVEICALMTPSKKSAVDVSKFWFFFFFFSKNKFEFERSRLLTPTLSAALPFGWHSVAAICHMDSNYRILICDLWHKENSNSNKWNWCNQTNERTNVNQMISGIFIFSLISCQCHSHSHCTIRSDLIFKNNIPNQITRKFYREFFCCCWFVGWCWLLLFLWLTHCFIAQLALFAKWMCATPSQR